MDLIERRYVFGNDKFSLEDAYHDCKSIFDGIADDDSFQEADEGLMLYYANEIIYALHKALEGKDTNALGNDCISRRAVIDAIQKLNIPEDMCVFEIISHIEAEIATLPSAEPRKWTPIKEGPPKKFGHYLVTITPPAGELWSKVEIAHYSDLMGISKPCFWIGNVGKNDFEDLTELVTAWAPCPDPYKEGKV